MFNYILSDNNKFHNKPKYFDRSSFNLLDQFDFPRFCGTFAILTYKIWLLDDFTEAELNLTAWRIHFSKRLTAAKTKRKLKYFVLF